MERNIEDNPARCRLKIVKSILGPGCPSRSDNGGKIVQRLRARISTRDELINKIKAGGSSQKDRLFSLGNAISAIPKKIGINQFPKVPIIIGIITKKSLLTGGY